LRHPEGAGESRYQVVGPDYEVTEDKEDAPKEKTDGQTSRHEQQHENEELAQQ
jgi:hypothetical protein